ncbi:MAG: hypothetical protein KC457_30930 [Myxococcales bacterium]|nr:hypothetical protein [Myxococcales bacterium]
MRLATLTFTLTSALACDPLDQNPGPDTDGAPIPEPSSSPALFGPKAPPQPPPDPDKPQADTDKEGYPGVCGNGILEPDEACDLGDSNDDHGACTTACKLPKCGDGFLQPGEACDAGPANTDDDSYASCRTDCTHGGPYCGDHDVDPDHEECDEGPQGDDTCTAVCSFVGYVAFVTSTVYTGAQVEGLVEADFHCKVQAQKAGLPRATHFMAWLSTSNEDAKNRLAHVELPYFRLDGEMVAHHWGDLTDGSLLHAIAVNEYAEPVDGQAWTNTGIDGESASVLDCNNWTLNSPLDASIYGEVDSSGPLWTDSGDFAPCSHEKRLYCLEQPTDGG